MRRFLAVGVFVILAVVIVGYGYLSWQRYQTIKVVSERAQEEHPGSRVEALMSYLDSSNISLRDQNRLIWVLGELRDPRALEKLQALVGSETCDHDEYVCQREIRKAVRKITGKTPNPYFWQRIDGT